MMRLRKPNDKERAALAALPAIGIYLGLQHFMQDERAFLVALSAYVFYALIDTEWERRRDVSFWVVLSVFAAAHAVVLSIIQIPHFRGPSLSIALPFMFIDGFAMFGILKWIGKRSPDKLA
jgi:hypothetical protein